MALVATVEVGFGNQGSKRFLMSSVHEMLIDMGADVTQFYAIAGIMLASTQVVHITFKLASEATAFLEKFGGVTRRTIEGKAVQIVIKDPNVTEKFVRISDFPANGNLDVVKTRLREFGAVLDIRRDRYRTSAAGSYIDCFTGNITARMTLDTPIPSYLNIGDYKTYVRYEGQPITCRACNLPGHLGAQCPTVKKPPMITGKGPKPARPPLPASWAKKTTPTTTNEPPQLSEVSFPPLPRRSERINTSQLPGPKENGAAPDPPMEQDPVIEVDMGNGPKTPAPAATAVEAEQLESDPATAQLVDATPPVQELLLDPSTSQSFDVPTPHLGGDTMEEGNGGRESDLSEPSDIEPTEGDMDTSFPPNRVAEFLKTAVKRPNPPSETNTAEKPKKGRGRKKN